MLSSDPSTLSLEQRCFVGNYRRTREHFQTKAIDHRVPLLPPGFERVFSITAAPNGLPGADAYFAASQEFRERGQQIQLQINDLTATLNPLKDRQEAADAAAAKRGDDPPALYREQLETMEHQLNALRAEYETVAADEIFDVDPKDLPQGLRAMSVRLTPNPVTVEQILGFTKDAATFLSAGVLQAILDCRSFLQDTLERFGFSGSLAPLKARVEAALTLPFVHDDANGRATLSALLHHPSETVRAKMIELASQVDGPKRGDEQGPRLLDIPKTSIALSWAVSQIVQGDPAGHGRRLLTLSPRVGNPILEPLDEVIEHLQRKQNGEAGRAVVRWLERAEAASEPAERYGVVMAMRAICQNSSWRVALQNRLPDLELFRKLVSADRSLGRSVKQELEAIADDVVTSLAPRLRDHYRSKNLDPLWRMIDDIKLLAAHRDSKPDGCTSAAEYMRSGALLYGPPGCGKTYFAKLLQGEFKGGKLYEITYQGSSAEEIMNGLKTQLVEVKKAAADHLPVVVLFDETEVMFPSRRQKPSPEEQSRTCFLLSAIGEIRTLFSGGHTKIGNGDNSSPADQ